MKLTPAMQAFILHWGDMGTKWGVNRSVAQIHALLHIAPNPMTADEICETLSLARSNVSTALKELQGWQLVSANRQLGDRRDHFHSVRDMFDLVTVVVEGRRAREYLPTLNALYDVAKDAETDSTPADVQARIAETLETMQQFDDWYSDISRIPRGIQKTLLSLGAKITRFIPKSG
ncbi:MAG: MarR family transcriptional regulator [Pseudomonadota bacterium]